MTTLSQRKTRLAFTTDNLIRGREIVVCPEPLVCNLRLKGKRTTFSINWITVYEHAAKIAADRMRAEKKAARLARRKAGAR